MDLEMDERVHAASESIVVEPPFRLSDREWLVVFPAPILYAASPFPYDRDTKHSDRAEELRRADPLTLDALLDALRPFRVLHAVFTLQLSKISATITTFNRLPNDLLRVPLWGLVFYFLPPTGRYSAAAMASATVAFAVHILVWDITILGFGFFRHIVWRTKGEGSSNRVRDEDVEAEKPSSNPLDTHIGAQLVRWLQIRGRSPMSGTTRSPLVEHVAGDALCPCDREECAGWFPRVDGAIRVVYLLFCTASSVFVWSVLCSWSLFVTMAAEFWPVWWAGLLGTVNIAALCIVYGCNFLNAWFFQPNFLLIGLEKRLQNRAASLTLDSFVTRCAAALRDNGPDPPSGDEEYQVLHEALAAVWRTRTVVGAGGRRSLVVNLAVELFLSGVICLAATGCIPVWILGSAVVSGTLIVKDLLENAFANGGIRTVSSLYILAANRLRALVLSSSLPLTPRQAAIHSRPASHIETLERLAAAPDLEATFPGFSVTFSSVRVVLVTSVTVLVALWSVLRGLGARVSVENVCPY
ncbi:hypothetical protein DFJ74DRAFT_465128 [Hyaloraphidium curvatum]|nr:hypothetical protein DFJ74DRAFT_465128 [Hyaloraphidium curvatum]